MTDNSPSAERPQPPSDASPATAPSRARRRLRFVLLVLVPVVGLAVGGYFYVSAQRFASTDNAYVKADMVSISARVSAPIAEIDVAENQHVDKGDVLFRLSPDLFKVALDRADANVGQVRDQIASLKATYKQKQEELNLAKANLKYAQLVYDSQSKLRRRDISPQASLDSAAHDLATARRQVEALRYDLAATLASLGGDPKAPIESQPLYQQAKAGRDQAQLDLEHTVIRAPFAGVASKTPQIGQFVQAGVPVMSIVADSGAWIEANFKETDLAYIRQGQPVSIGIDAYPGHTWVGTVQSFSQATGSEFSVLPAQNATGNWVKVVQRVPVRIALQTQHDAPPLRAGMSATVSIDTGHEPALPKFVLAAVNWMDGLLKVSAAHATSRQ